MPLVTIGRRAARRPTAAAIPSKNAPSLPAAPAPGASTLHGPLEADAGVARVAAYMVGAAYNLLRVAPLLEAPA